MIQFRSKLVRITIMTLLASIPAFTQQPCPSGYHHEGSSAACWPDVSHWEKLQQAEPATTESTVIVYRAKAIFVGRAVHPPVFLDNHRIGSLGTGRYITVHAQPGPHKLVSNQKKPALEITLHPGETLYFEIQVHSDSGWHRGWWQLAEVPADIGKKQITDIQAEPVE
jgi:hypothetical protein